MGDALFCIIFVVVIFYFRDDICRYIDPEPLHLPLGVLGHLSRRVPALSQSHVIHVDQMFDLRREMREGFSLLVFEVTIETTRHGSVIVPWIRPGAPTPAHFSAKNVRAWLDQRYCAISNRR